MSSRSCNTPAAVLVLVRAPALVARRRHQIEPTELGLDFIGNKSDNLIYPPDQQVAASPLVANAGFGPYVERRSNDSGLM